jgi:DNA-binding beta-propeller fold protein YncE
MKMQPRFAMGLLCVGLLGTGYALPGYAHPAPAAAPKLLSVTAVPAMPEGDFDQFAVDEATNRLFLSAEAGAAIDVFDLKTGRLLQSGGPVASPHKVIVDPPSRHLFVADGDDGSVKVLDEKLGLIAKIAVGPHPDTGAYDAGKRLFYVGSRVDAGATATSIISVISTETMAVADTIAIPATTLKGMILDTNGHRLLVGMRDKNEIAVVNLETKSVSLWSPPGLNQNVPMALDSADHLLFVGSRRPGKLSVLDPRDGRVLAELPSTNISDSMFYDDKGRILYVTGDDGLSRYRVSANGLVSPLGTDAAVAGKSSLLLAGVDRLFVARPKKKGQIAALEIYDVGRSSD